MSEKEAICKQNAKSDNLSVEKRIKCDKRKKNFFK